MSNFHPTFSATQILGALVSKSLRGEVLEGTPLGALIREAKAETNGWDILNHLQFDLWGEFGEPEFFVLFEMDKQ